MRALEMSVSLICLGAVLVAIFGIAMPIFWEAARLLSR